MNSDPNKPVPVKPVTPRPAIRLDYATETTQLDPREQHERERRAALDNYNESTFGKERWGRIIAVAGCYLTIGNLLAKYASWGLFGPLTAIVAAALLWFGLAKWLGD